MKDLNENLASENTELVVGSQKVPAEINEESKQAGTTSESLQHGATIKA